MPSTPSQKSTEVCRLAPTNVIWCTPCACNLFIRQSLRRRQGAVNFCRVAPDVSDLGRPTQFCNRKAASGRPPFARGDAVLTIMASAEVYSADGRRVVQAADLDNRTAS